MLPLIVFQEEVFLRCTSIYRPLSYPFRSLTSTNEKNTFYLGDHGPVDRKYARQSCECADPHGGQENNQGER